MEVYGKQDLGSDPAMLREVALLVTVDEIRELIEFLSNCSRGIAENPGWDHEHFKDFCKNDSALADLVIALKRK